MNEKWRLITRNCVFSAKFFCIVVILLLAVTPTNQQQRDIKTKWDNRLLPTNFVYERDIDVPSINAPSSLRSQNENNVMDNSKGNDPSSSYENSENNERTINESENIYDDDYEIEEPLDDATNVSGTFEKTENSEKPEKNSRNERMSSEITSEASIVQDDNYYYYDDYDNSTSSEHEAADKDLVDYFDGSEESSVSQKPEKNEKISETSLERSSKLELRNNHSSVEETLIKTNLTSQQASNSSLQEKHEFDDEPKLQDDEILIGEAVVSVVTTKSVVNGTISVPDVSPMPMTTEQINAPNVPNSTPNPGVDYSSGSEADVSSSSADVTETTEDSRIVASVQTSRSISGARFLPFLVIDGVEKNSPDGENDTKSSEKHLSDDESDKKEKNSTSMPVESTESIIDKLDRVQSELSSGFLASGFRNSGNTLQLDVLGEQRPQQTRKSFTTTSRTPVISKFVPRRYNQDGKFFTSSTTISSVFGKITDSTRSIVDAVTTEKAKTAFRWPSSSRNARPTSSTTESNFGSRNLRNFGLNSSIKSRTPAPITGSTVQDLSAFLPPGYKLKKEDAAVTEKSILNEILAKSKVDLSSLLPPNYKLNNKSTEETKTKNMENKTDENMKNSKNLSDKSLESLFTKTKVDLSSLLPPDFSGNKPKNVQHVTKEEKIEDSTESTAKTEKSILDLFSKSSVDISALLPPGYNNRFRKEEIIKTDRTTSATSSINTTPITVGTTAKPAPGGIKLVFPSRPGGRKAIQKATTTHSSRVEGSGAVTPRIQKGWPTRATTEFTGWPTPSTTPISIEKLLEAARTATVSSTNISAVPTTSTSSTTSTSTTTTTTQRPTTPGICEDECEVAGTIKIIGNATWVPELLDRNTREWQELAEDIEKEMNLVFVKSPVLRKWYKRVRIDAFSPGSVLVDYFIELTDLRERINTQQLKVIFHDSLRNYNSDKWNVTRTKGPIRLGNFSLDPKSTDFVVIPKVNFPQHIAVDDRLIPQWAIAVIVIGVGGLLFIIVFGVSVLVNRQNAAKLKPTATTYNEEVAKSMIQASHGAPSHRSSQDYPKSEISTIWNDNDMWRDKSFESNSNEVLVDGTLGHERSMDRCVDDRKYNMYDSWRSEWNGYYCNQHASTQGSSKFTGYETTASHLSHHPPDYDTNF